MTLTSSHLQAIDLMAERPELFLSSAERRHICVHDFGAGAEAHRLIAGAAG
jgi:hypothetical protein